MPEETPLGITPPPAARRRVVGSSALAPFQTTVFTELTLRARERGAINLAQGFPDFDGPRGIVEAAVDALRAGENQYAPAAGHPRLAEAIAGARRRAFGLHYDASEVCVFCGATEGLAASLLGLLDPGDEVVLIEPFYESYPVCAALSGARVRCCRLRPPGFELDAAELETAFTPRTRLLVLNSPHNPTGRVFRLDELEAIARLCRERDVIVVSDEVYEHLTYGEARHVPIASLPGMRERTLTISSTGKTFSLTGWKIGWAIGPADLVAAARAAHQVLTFCAATPLQAAMASALERYGEEYLAGLRADYAERRDFLVSALRQCGAEPLPPEGAYFVVADFGAVWRADGASLSRHLLEEAGVAAIPLAAFRRREPRAPAEARLRFAFCKRMETLESAADRLLRWSSRRPPSRLAR